MRLRRDEQSEDTFDNLCRVCGCDGPLTFEHLPPKAAGNSARAEMIGLEEWLTQTHTGEPGKGQLVQRGSGSYTLCERCNNRSGREYVPELLRWIESANHALTTTEPSVEEMDQMLTNAYMTAYLKQVKPARFMKQVITMLLALSPGGFGRRNLALLEYAQDPNTIGLPSEYQVYLALFASPTARFNGGTGMMKLGPTGTTSTVVLELAYPPFMYALTIDEDELSLDCGNITGFADLTIDQTADVELQMRVGFGHTIFPLDLRTRAQLDRDIKKNEAAG